MHPVAQVAAVEARDLAVARDEHGRVAVHLGVDLLVRELVDLVRPCGRLEERLTIELPGRALERELGREHLLEPLDVVVRDGLREIVSELDELVRDGGGRHPASILAASASASDSSNA